MFGGFPDVQAAVWDASFPSPHILPRSSPMFPILIIAAAGMLIPSISLSVADRTRRS
jgi:hypothetical protein